MGNGSTVNMYEVYGSGAQSSGKSNGLGDIEFVCMPPPVQIGNLIWMDDNENGIQDAGESGLENVTISLEKESGDVLGTVETNANGVYIFTSASVEGTFEHVAHIDFVPGTTYVLDIPISQASLPSPMNVVVLSGLVDIGTSIRVT